MSVNESDYSGAVGIVHFSDESINDPNCLCFATEGNATDADKWENLEYGNVFNYKSRIVQLDKDLSGLKKIQFSFAGCNSLQKLFIHGKNVTRPTDWEKQTFAKIVGSFDELIHSNCGFRNITNVKSIELNFPKLVRCIGDFYNCTSLETLNTNFSKCLIAEQEFDLCSKLTKVTFNGGLNKLMYASGMFSNCTSLKNFKYKLPVLLSGKRMFYKCNLNADSAKTILGSLPEIKHCRSTNNTVGTDALLNIIKGWTKGEFDFLDGVLKEIKRDYSTNNNRMIIYFKYPKYNYQKGETDSYYVNKKGETVGFYSSKVINYDDFGVLDLGVENVDTNVDSVKKSSQLKEAIANGWKIYINNTLQDAFYYGKEGTIIIKEKTTVAGVTSSQRIIFEGTYSAYGARQKGEDGKLNIKILKTKGDLPITLTIDEIDEATGKAADEATIEPKSTTNDDGSFKENKKFILKFKNVQRKIKVSSDKTTLSISAENQGNTYDIILS